MKNPYLLSLFLIFIALCISIYPDIYRITIAPAGTFFPLIHNYPDDYFGYLQYMHQGFEGSWLITSRFTPEHFKPYFVYSLYSLLGQISRITHINLPWMYFLSRVIFGAFMIISITVIIRKLFNKNSFFIAVILVLFSTGFWTISSQSLPLNRGISLLPIYQFLSYWSRFDPINRTTYIPHHLISTGFGILSIYYFVLAIEEQKKTKALIAGFLGLVSGFIFYSTIINILGGIVIGFLLYCFTKAKNSNQNEINIFLKNLPHLLIYTIMSVLSLIYLYYVSHTTFPWTNYDSLGIQYSFKLTLLDYTLALGPTFLLTLIGIKKIINNNSLLSKILLGWIITPFIGFFILVPLFPKYGNMIYLEATSYIPLGILAGYGIKKITNTLTNKKSVKLILILLLIIYFIPPLTSSLQKELHAFPTYVYNLYIPQDILTAINWLDQNSPSESVVLAGGYFGNIIPGFSHNRVVYGHKDATYSPNTKHNETLIFFSQQDITKAKLILSQYHVSYIFFSLDTDPPQNKFIKALNLHKVYENNNVKIFQVKEYYKI